MVRAAAMRSAPLRGDATPVVAALPPPLPLAARRGTIPASQDPAAVIRALTAIKTFPEAANLVQREACRLTRASDAMVVVVDWARSLVWTLHRQVTVEATQRLVVQVAGTGERSVHGTSVFEPLGNAPACLVLAVRRPPEMAFQPGDVVVIAAFAAKIAPILQRLVTPR